MTIETRLDHTMLGYARVSTLEQDEALQVDALRSAGCRRVFVDKASGKLARRPEWDKCFEHLRRGDELVITRLSRPFRSVRHMTELAARQVYEQAGLGPEDFGVIELHDCFSANELLTYEALGLCGEGEAGKLVDNDDTTYGGRWVVNPSGGLISKGHPLGATGLAQCAELSWQLRGEADARQVEGVTAALQHNIGLGGAVVVTAYRPANR